ncbi:hypothetical protein B5N75_11770 [Salmonella enterica]|uniref:Uncharacterized protein n=1 Tax=Salmonella enterica I TaxID=59201 RepID=A0A7Z1QH35_SALET|nr:hypothetical protein [Salmonella enterica]EAW1192535.1 hypothetical protein [Salmonella enterica subsp. enterica]ECC3883656.1 hypothetical protein [Salmonella enterica subsp. diarizonae]ECT9714837.1 hypothetical protein [Salmonella enterica subsp. diarizonae str. CFSAN000553]EAM3004946.1 hypothetical protein [Salmonella enterica]
MRLISHKFSDLINLDVRKGGAETPNAAIIGISVARYQSGAIPRLICWRCIRRCDVKAFSFNADSGFMDPSGGGIRREPQFISSQRINHYAFILA